MVRSLSTPSALLLPAFFLLGTALTAPDAALAAKGPLAGLDGNADGAVTRTEFETARRADFDRIDKNGDGALSRFEFYDRGGPEDLDLLELRKQRYRLLDADKDGKVSREEYVAAGAKIFAAVDRDGDGSLSGEEIAAARGTQVASRDTGTPPSSPKAEDDAKTPKRDRNGAEATRAETARAARPAPANPARTRDVSLEDTDDKALGDLPFAAVDADDDGAVSLKEYDRALLVLFRRLDRNGNKVLSRREYYRRGSPRDESRLAARKRAYRGADKDDDGGLTFAEVRAMTHGLFFRIDGDDDKRLSRAEWVAAFGPQETPSRPTTVAARRPAPDTPAPEAPAPEAPAREAKPDSDPKPMRRAEPAKAETPDSSKKPARDVREMLKAETRDSRPSAAEDRKDDRKADRNDDRKTEMAARPPADETPSAADAERRQRIAQAFAGLDRDQDKHISALELTFARMARFTALDTNGNRVLEQREFVGERGPAAARRFAEMDRDGDRIVIWNEYKAAGNARFAQLDADGDGKLSLDEFSSAGKAKPRKGKTGRRTAAKQDDEPDMPFEYELPSR